MTDARAIEGRVAETQSLRLDPVFRFMPSFGYSATVSWVIVVLVGILSLAQFIVARERRRS